MQPPTPCAPLCHAAPLHRAALYAMGMNLAFILSVVGANAALTRGVTSSDSHGLLQG